MNEPNPAAPVRRDRWSWVPEGLTTILLATLVVAIGYFFQLFWTLRFRIGIDPKMAIALAIAFLVIELYLLRRVMVQVGKTRSLWAASRESKD